MGAKHGTGFDATSQALNSLDYVPRASLRPREERGISDLYTETRFIRESHREHRFDRPGGVDALFARRSKLFLRQP